MKGFSDKASRMSASMTLALTAKASSMRESGLDVVSFGVGEPDFNTPQNIIDAAIIAMNTGKNKYTAASGLLELKELICEKLKEDNSLTYKSENIIVSTGAKQALANTFMALLNDGDEVIVPSPYWVSYPELISLAGGKPVFAITKAEDDFKITAQQIKEASSNRTKAIVLNSPNNPTGVVYTKEELSKIADMCKELDLYIISDEIYEKLNYDNENPHVSIASLSDDAFERTIVINGLSKSHAMTGWRIGYAAAHKQIVSLMGKIQSHTTSNPNTIAQYAAIEALKGSNESLDKMVAIFLERRNLMVSYLDKMKNIDYIVPKGAFYCFVNIEKLLGKKYKDSSEFAAKLLEKENVMVIPGIAFGNDKYIRLSYATSKENIEKGMERLLNFANFEAEL